MEDAAHVTQSRIPYGPVPTKHSKCTERPFNPGPCLRTLALSEGGSSGYYSHSLLHSAGHVPDVLSNRISRGDDEFHPMFVVRGNLPEAHQWQLSAASQTRFGIHNCSQPARSFGPLHASARVYFATRRIRGLVCRRTRMDRCTPSAYGCLCSVVTFPRTRHEIAALHAARPQITAAPQPATRSAAPRPFETAVSQIRRPTWPSGQVGE